MKVKGDSHETPAFKRLDVGVLSMQHLPRGLHFSTFFIKTIICKPITTYNKNFLLSMNELFAIYLLPNYWLVYVVHIYHADSSERISLSLVKCATGM